MGPLFAIGMGAVAGAAAMGRAMRARPTWRLPPIGVGAGSQKALSGIAQCISGLQTIHTIASNAVAPNGGATSLSNSEEYDFGSGQRLQGWTQSYMTQINRGWTMFAQCPASKMCDSRALGNLISNMNHTGGFKTSSGYNASWDFTQYGPIAAAASALIACLQRLSQGAANAMSPMAPQNAGFAPQTFQIPQPPQIATPQPAVPGRRPFSPAKGSYLPR